jgi:hypothetical protein
MIINKDVQIILNPRNINTYRELGYIIPDKPIGKIISVSLRDVTKGSHIHIESICDYCSIIKNIKYKEYNRNITHNGKFSCSNKCGSIKKKEISILKYGVESPSMLDSVKNKNKETCNIRYGKDYYMSTDEFKELSRESMISKYGVSQPMHSEEIKKRLRDSLLKNWGVINIFQSQVIKDKIKLINIDKFGVDHYSKTAEFKDKCKKTNIEKYGVDSFSKTDEFKYKIAKTSLNKWGTNTYMHTDDFRKKSKEFFRENHGAEYANQSEELRKSNNRNCKDINYIKYLGNSLSLYRCDRGHEYEISSSNYHSRIAKNIPICTICNPIGDSKSIKELELFRLISSIYTDEIIQSYRNVLEIDIYLPNLKIGFEFNGLYWHSDKFKDKKYHVNKTKYFKKLGISIIHIWEDDWDFRKEIVIGKINSILGIEEILLNSDICEIREVSNSDIKSFIETNNIDLYEKSNIGIGLYNGNELVSLMTFNNYRTDKFELTFYCTKIGYNIINGDSKILNHFKNKYGTVKIISYDSLDWSNSFYQRADVKPIAEIGPEYRINKYISCDKRVWNCGKTKFEIIL